MKKIKSALSLALLVAAPAIYAQNIDTKAPAEPGFMVTLNVTDKGSAADTVWIRDYKNTKDSVELKGNQVKYGSYLRIGLKARPGQTIDSLKVGGKKAIWTGTADEKNILGTLTFTAGNPNLYSLPLGQIKSETNVMVAWKEKASWNLTFENTTQTVNTSGATAVTVKDNGTGNADIIKGYYKTNACEENDKLSNGASDIKTAGTYYVKLQADETADKKGLDMVIPLVVNNKLALTVATQPSVASGLIIKEGQLLYNVPLTAGTCKYGERVIKGTWAWENPNLVLSKGTNTCKAIFTPDSSAIYNNATSGDITVSALYVAAVTVEQSAGGTVTIDDATPDNKYVGTTSAYADVKVTATPATGYKFVSWASPAEQAKAASTEKYEEAKTREIKAAPDGTVIKAVFAKATRKITFTASPDNGTVKVLNGDKEIATDANISYGTNLTIVAEPASGKQVKSVSYAYKKSDSDTGTTTSANNFVVGGEEGGSYAVTVEFEDIPNQKVMVNVTAPVNGSITMLDKDNKAVNPNSSVDKGSALTIVAVPNRGYKLASLRAGDTEVTGDYITVNTAITIAASFVKEEYLVQNLAPEQVEFSNVSFGKSEFNTSIKNVKASIKEAYKGTHKLVSLLLNNQAIANGDNDLLVEGDMNFSALVKTLEPVNIQNEKETKVIYNGNAQVYTVKTAANLADFKVTFKKDGNEVVAPSTVGKYQVIITREADELYAAYSNEKDYTLEILPGVPGVLDIPFSDKLTDADVAAKTTVAGEWLDQAAFQSKYPNREPATKAGNSSVIYFVPSDDNLGYVKTTTVPASEASNAKTVTITYATNDANDHGTVSVENDFVPVGNKTYSGLNLTLNAKVEAGYKIDWSKITVTDGTLKNDHTFTVSGNVAVNVAADAFTLMSTPSYKTNQSVNATYTGRSLACTSSALGLAPDVAWKVQYVKQDASNHDAYTTPDPVDAGTYKIKVSCDNGTTYSALAETEIGTLTIKPQQLVVTNIKVPNASPVAKNAMLSTSILDTNGKVTDAQGNPVPGQFTWEDDKKVTSAGDQNVIFTPSDQNNYSVEGLQLHSYVSLKGVASYLMTVKAENGNASNLVFTDATGNVINPATDNKVPAGMKLFITTTSGTIEAVTVSGANASSGSEAGSGEPTKWYCIAGSEAFTVTVTFKSGTEGGGDTPSEGVAVTGISLNKSTLTLAPKKSEKLVATVTPTGATKKDVKWTSTDPTIASVDADGTVKALKAGKATIIATTVDGGFTAMCEVTVDAATGIEKILSESRVYGQRGQIVIEPAAPVEATIVNMAGVMIYKSLVNGMEQVPAYSGIYIVRLSASGKATTTKVIVR
ncbi:Ig-like domain-containing protein [Parabacteroides sp.]